MHLIWTAARNEIFGISGGNPPPTLQFENSSFDKMPHTIDILIITPQAVTTFSRWNDWMDAIFLEDSYQSITVIPLIRQKIFSSYPFNKSASLRTVCNGTCCNKHSDRHTMRIHGQVYL